MPKTGSKATRSGIYKCADCGKRLTINSTDRFPPCGCGGTSWKLVSATTKAPKARKKQRAKAKKRGFFESLFG